MGTGITETEMAVLRVLWEHGPGTVREILERLNQSGRKWAYTTVLTFLQRLREKGVVRRDESALAHVFAATVSRDELLQERLGELADEFCDGAATPLMLALAERQEFSDDETDRLRRLLDTLEADAGPEQKKQSKRTRRANKAAGRRTRSMRRSKQ